MKKIAGLLFSLWLFCAGCSMANSSAGLGHDLFATTDQVQEGTDHEPRKLDLDEQNEQVKEEVEWNEWEDVTPSDEEIQEMQETADGGHRVGLLDPLDVGATYVNGQFGEEYGRVDAFNLIEQHEVEQTMRYTFENNCDVEVTVNRSGPTATRVWYVTAFRKSTTCD